MTVYKVSSGDYQILVFAYSPEHAASKFVSEVIRIINSNQITLGRIIIVEHTPDNILIFASDKFLRVHGYIGRAVNG